MHCIFLQKEQDRYYPSGNGCRTLTIASIFLCSILSLEAQEVYSFDKCVEIAVKQNPDYLVDALEYEKAVIAQRSTSLSRLPDLNANVNTSLNNGRALDPITYQYNTQTFLFNNISLQSRLMLFDGNRTNLQVDQGHLFSDIQKYKMEDTRLNMIKDILSVYADIQMQQELIQLWQMRIDALNQQKEKTELQVESGRKTASSVMELEIEISKAYQATEELNFRRAVGELKLKSILNLPLSQEFTIDKQSGNTVLIDTSGRLDNARIEKIIAQTSGYKEATTQSILAQKNIRIAKSYYKPTLSLNGMIATGYSSRFQNSGINLSNSPATQFDNNFYQNVSLNLYIPVFNRFQTSSNVKKYKVSQLQSERQKDQAYLKLRDMITNMNNDATFSAKKYVHVNRALSQFGLILNEAEINLNYGRIDQFEYLYKEQQKFILEQNKIELKYRYLVSSKCLELFEYGKVSY
jgi:outer membrane protein